jgi:hypothetical protein
MPEVVNQETATTDLTLWMDGLKISQAKRKQQESTIEILIGEIVEGNLWVNDDNTLTYKPKYPIESDQSALTVNELTFKTRVKYEQLEPYLKQIKPGDADGRLLCYTAALTGKPLGLLKKLEMVDIAICNSIAVFFL